VGAECRLWVIRVGSVCPLSGHCGPEFSTQGRKGPRTDSCAATKGRGDSTAAFLWAPHLGHLSHMTILALDGDWRYPGSAVTLFILRILTPLSFTRAGTSICGKLDANLRAACLLVTATQGQCQSSRAAMKSGNGSIDWTISVLTDKASAPRSETTVAIITRPPNISCRGLISLLK
jgi:hypothetical protein